MVDRRKDLAHRLSRAVEMEPTIDRDELVRMVHQVKTDRTVHQPHNGMKNFLELVFFALLRRKSLPPLATVRFACRLVRQNREFCYCEPILQTIAHSDQLHAHLVAHARAIRAARTKRLAECVQSTAYKQALQQYLSAVCHPYAVPSIDFCNPGEGSFAARTNGKRIFLPYAVDASDDDSRARLINESVLFYLAFHEMQHWGVFGARSSFEFSFETDEGRQLLSEIAPERSHLEDVRDTREAIGTVSADPA